MTPFRHPHYPHGGRGFTLVELMVGLTVMTVGILGYLQAMTRSEKSARTSRQVSSATLDASNILEQIASVPFEDAYARYNADPGDNPAVRFQACIAHQRLGQRLSIAPLKRLLDDPDPNTQAAAKRAPASLQP